MAVSTERCLLRRRLVVTFYILCEGDCRPAIVACARAEPNSGNGADMGGYSWTQTLGDVVLSVPVPPGTKGRQCAVDMKKNSISVGLAGAPPLLAGELWAPVQAEECFWNVDGRALEVTLQKARIPGALLGLTCPTLRASGMWTGARWRSHCRRRAFLGLC